MVLHHIVLLFLLDQFLNSIKVKKTICVVVSLCSGMQECFDFYGCSLKHWLRSPSLNNLTKGKDLYN